MPCSMLKPRKTLRNQTKSNPHKRPDAALFHTDHVTMRSRFRSKAMNSVTEKNNGGVPFSPRTMSRLREHAKALGVDVVASDLLEMMAQDDLYKAVLNNKAKCQ